MIWFLTLEYHLPIEELVTKKRELEMTPFFEHQRTSYKRNYLKNLIKLASTDGLLDTEERTLIAQIGLKRGLKECQINELLESNSTEFEVFIPESVNNRMNMLYDLMQIIYADNNLTDQELDYMKSIVADFRLQPEIVKELIRLFSNQTPSMDEWRNFVEFVHLEYAQS